MIQREENVSEKGGRVDTVLLLWMVEERAALHPSDTGLQQREDRREPGQLDTTEKPPWTPTPLCRPHQQQEESAPCRLLGSGQR